MSDKIKYTTRRKCNTFVDCMAELNDETIGTCVTHVSDNNTKWTISAWYVTDEYQNQGIGKVVLAKALKKLYAEFGRPAVIQYNWNGTNMYVRDWLFKHFEPTVQCPLWVLKNQVEDDWASHIFELNIDKVFEYFNIQ